jgi:hypothetical protein
MLSGSRTELQRQVANLLLPRGSELLFRDVALTIVSTRRTHYPLVVAKWFDWTYTVRIGYFVRGSFWTLRSTEVLLLLIDAKQACTAVCVINMLWGVHAYV